MIGREAYQNPYFLAEIERDIFGNENVKSRDEIIEELLRYIENCLRSGSAEVKDITRHTLGLYRGVKGGKRWRQILSEEVYKPHANTNIVREALKQIQSYL